MEPLGGRPQPPTDPAQTAVSIGLATVIGGGILEVFGGLVILTGCSSVGFGGFLLIVATIGLFIGAIVTLVLAARNKVAPPRRGRPRGFGIAAVVMAIVSLPINGFLVLLSQFCRLG
jgi:MFS family permease